jgi:hypothetical protein
MPVKPMGGSLFIERRRVGVYGEVGSAARHALN